MRQQPQQSNSKIFWLAFGIISFGLTFYFMGGSDAPATTKTHKVVAKSSSSSTADDQLLPEDYKAKFDRMPATNTDIFKPVIYHQSSVVGAGSNLINAIPPEYASGEQNWVFTGTGEINSAKQANFENDKAGQFVEVNQGEHWKSSVVSEIGPDYVVLVGPNDKKKIPMPNDVVTAAPTVAANAAPANTPVNPFAGPIGGAASAPATDDAAAAAAAMQQNMNFGGGGGGRGRRGRGGGGRRGGGGGGGGFGGGG
ncbi:MAG TPA: hypothetical protein VGL56_07065 [Fimbriimonadaceae bacterium]|jgi:hypothetical protein